MDATELLKKDHQEVTKLFQRFHSGPAGRARRSLIDRICQELTVHMQIEEEIFYPAVRNTGDAELSPRVDESLREHQRIKEHVQALRARSSGEEKDGRLESVVATLQQDVEQHLTEEEGEMFPRVEEVMDERRLSEIARRLRERKQALAGAGAMPRRRRAAAARKPAAVRGRRAKATRRHGKTAGAKSPSRKKTRTGTRGR